MTGRWLDAACFERAGQRWGRAAQHRLRLRCGAWLLPGAPTSDGRDVQNRHRNQSVATMVMSQCSAARCVASFGIFSITSSCRRPHPERRRATADVEQENDRSTLNRFTLIALSGMLNASSTRCDRADNRCRAVLAPLQGKVVRASWQQVPGGRLTARDCISTCAPSRLCENMFSYRMPEPQKHPHHANSGRSAVRRMLASGALTHDTITTGKFEREGFEHAIVPAFYANRRISSHRNVHLRESG